jgi:hypothetical protein
MFDCVRNELGLVEDQGLGLVDATGLSAVLAG